jgi:aminopeptidase N
LKEGFTVFRDQSFSDTLQSPAVQRIDDVSSLKSAQFAEDAGPMSHPPRPDHFVEINNFYTATVYDKGAEIVRMVQVLICGTSCHGIANRERQWSVGKGFMMRL